MKNSVLAWPSQGQRSLAEFSHTGAEQVGLLTHTIGSDPSHSHITDSWLQLDASCPHPFPPLPSLPFSIWDYVFVCVRTTHPDSSSGALFPWLHTVLHTVTCHTHPCTAFTHCTTLCTIFTHILSTNTLQVQIIYLLFLLQYLQIFLM